MLPKRTQRFLSQFIWSKSGWSWEPQSTALSDLIFTIKKWQNSKNKITFITEPKKVSFIKVELFFAIWALFEGEISIKISRESFKLSKYKLKVKVINKPSILVHVWLLCHIYVLFFMNHAFLNSKGYQAIMAVLPKNYLLIWQDYQHFLLIGGI